jgi:TRAP transporter TAXI family solute receptor
MTTDVEPGLRERSVDRRWLLQLLCLIGAGGFGCSAMSVAGAQAANEPETLDFRIGTGPTSSGYFVIGGIIANAISNPPGSRPCDRGGSCGVPGLIATAQTTQGSVQNVDLIAGKALDSGLCQSDVAYWRYTGSGMYSDRKPVDSLRAIANLYQESLHVIVRADSSIGSIADLAGKRVAIGERGSGTRATATLVLDTYGVGSRKIVGQQLPLATAVEGLQQGAIDAMFVVGGEPIPAIADLAEAVDVRLLAVDGDKAADLRREHPFLTIDLIPDGTYRQNGATITVGVGTYWLVLADLDETLTYEITTALWHKSTRKLLDEGSAVGRRIRMENALVGLPIPLHSGAQRYYAEMRAQGLTPAQGSN